MSNSSPEWVGLVAATIQEHWFTGYTLCACKHEKFDIPMEELAKKYPRVNHHVLEFEQHKAYAEHIAELLAPALARKVEEEKREARLDEAKWWKRQIESRLHGMAFHQQDVKNVADAIEAERISELEAKQP